MANRRPQQKIDQSQRTSNRACGNGSCIARVEDVAYAVMAGVIIHGEQLPRGYVLLQDASRDDRDVGQSIHKFVAR